MYELKVPTIKILFELIINWFKISFRPWSRCFFILPIYEAPCFIKHWWLQTLNIWNYLVIFILSSISILIVNIIDPTVFPFVITTCNLVNLILEILKAY